MEHIRQRLRPQSLQALDQGQAVQVQQITNSQVSRHGNTSFGGGEEASHSQEQAARQGFRVKFGFKMAQPGLLAPLLTPFTPNCVNNQPSFSQQVPLTTRNNAIQLPITPASSNLNQAVNVAPSGGFGGLQAIRPLQMRSLAPIIAPMTPQMGGNIAFQRRQPVRQCNDETVCNARYGICIRKTQYRQQQEDRYMFRDNFKGNSSSACFAVFDGHGGQRAAEFARERLPTLLEEQLALESNVHVTLKQVFNQVDNEFLSIAAKDHSPDGSTALLAVLLNGRLTIANLGDSIATLVNQDGTWVQMNSEHSPNRFDERCRIEAANGCVFKNRVNGELSVSRAFGDIEMKDWVISEPECRTIPITHNEDLLILASDGIHRSYTQDQIVRRVRELRQQTSSLGEIAEQIVEECLRLEGGIPACHDNVTLIIVSLADYLVDYERRSVMNNTPQQLQLRRSQTLGGHIDTSAFTGRGHEFAADCVSILHLSSEEDRCSQQSAGGGSQVSTKINPFLVSSSSLQSDPSSQHSSPQQFCNPKSETLGLPYSASGNLVNYLNPTADL